MLGRSVKVSYLERVVGSQQTPAHQKAMRKRRVWVELLFGDAKQGHEPECFRLGRLETVHLEGLRVATG